MRVNPVHLSLTTSIIYMMLSMLFDVTAHAETTDTGSTGEVFDDALLPDDSWLDSLEQDVFEPVFRRNYAALNYGADNESNRQLSTQLQFAAGSSHAIDIAISQNQVNDITPAYTTRNYQLGLGSDHYDGFNWRISVARWGKDKTIETDDTSIELSYLSSDRWQSSVLLEQGDGTLYIDPIFSDRASSISSKRDAYGVTLGHSNSTGRWWVSYLKRNYERDLSLISTTPALQLILKSVALDQVYALSSKEYLFAYDWFLQDMTIGAELSRVNSIVDDSDSDFLSLNLRYYVNESFSIKTSVHDSLDSSHLTVIVGVGFNW